MTSLGPVVRLIRTSHYDVSSGSWSISSSYESTSLLHILSAMQHAQRPMTWLGLCIQWTVGSSMTWTSHQIIGTSLETTSRRSCPHFHSTRSVYSCRSSPLLSYFGATSFP
jgi:hypothetical protein